MASTRGRQVVVPLTNKSGGSVAAGDVVIVDTANDAAFATTTSGQAEVSVGVAQETIASNATGRVLTHGYAALVNVPASVTRGHYLETHTVAKQATGSSTRRSGSFGQFLTGGTTPTAVLWGQTDQTASGGSGGDCVLLSTQEVTGSVAATIDFSSISSSYRHLKLVCQVRGDTAAGSTTVLMRFNGDTGSNYDYLVIFGAGTSAGSGNGWGGTSSTVAEMAANSAPASTATPIEITITNYKNTAFHKTFVAHSFMRSGTSAGSNEVWGGTWRSTSAITSIRLTPGAGNFAVGSIASLYGLT